METPFPVYDLRVLTVTTPLLKERLSHLSYLAAAGCQITHLSIREYCYSGLGKGIGHALSIRDSAAATIGRIPVHVLLIYVIREEWRTSTD